MKKEVIAGIVGIVCLAAFFWVFTKVKRSGVLGRNFSIRVATDNMYNLRNKQFVMLNGWQVGVVASQEIAPDGKYIAVIDFAQPLELPGNSCYRKNNLKHQGIAQRSQGSGATDETKKET